MIKSFGDKDTEYFFKNFNTINPLHSKFPPDLYRRIMRKLLMINAASQLMDLSSIPGNACEKLNPKQSNIYSIRINDKYRITFRWENGDAFDVEVVDYHK